MKKVLLMMLLVLTLASCGKAYNSALKQVELGMTRSEIVSLMGNDYKTSDVAAPDETIEYVDRYKNHWFFVFDDQQRLVKWYKENEDEY